MEILIVYILSLILSEGSFSLTKSSRRFVSVSHDMLTRFLVQWLFEGFKDWEKLPRGGYIVLDDTVINKQYSKNIEGVSYQYSSNEKKKLNGLCFILVLWVYGNQSFVLDMLIWKKGGPTKNELVQAALRRYRLAGIQPKKVLFDAWYAASSTLNLLSSWGWTYLARIRSNRLFNNRHLKEYRFFGANGKYGKLKGVGHSVQIVKHGKRYLVTNGLSPLFSRSGAKLYKERWIVETVFQDLKMNLNLEKCSSRSLKAQENHIKSCLLAYRFFKTYYPDKSMKSAQQEFIANHDPAIFKQQMIQLLAA
jgi:Transposase DDE domain